MIKKYSLLILWLMCGTFFAAAENMDAWIGCAPLEFAGQEKYKALFVPEAVYEYAADGLRDIRIVDKEGGFVPFYIMSGASMLRQNQIVYQADLIQIFKKDADRYADFRIRPLKENTDIAGNMLVLSLPGENFLKYINIYGSFDGGSWDYIGKDYVFRAAGREKRDLSLGGTRKYTFYRLVMLDNPENIQFKSVQLINNYTDVEWSRFIKTAAAEFTVKTEKNYSTIAIANTQRLTIKRILLEVEENFQRSYQLYSDSVTAAPWEKGEIYNLQLENTKVSGTSIDTANRPLSSAQLLIRIDNRDDRPLKIKGIKIEYYVDKLVFPDLGSTPYRLYFGNKNVLKPQYELELQKAYIEKEPQDKAQVGEVQGKALEGEPPSSGNMKYVFNGSIIAVAILLVMLILTRLQAKK